MVRAMRPQRPSLRLSTALVVLLGCSAAVDGDSLPLDRIELPEGFAIELYSDAVPGARSLARSPSGTLFVGTRREGKVYALVGGDGDQRPERVHTVASGLRSPNGVAFLNGDLYVAEISRILRFPGIEERLADPPRPEVVFDDLPSDRHHGWKYLEVGPGGDLWFGIGAPCNVCDPGDPYASVVRLDLETRKLEIFARGVRNTVGLAFQPATGVLWFTDNGRDRMGDDVPPDELNVAPEPGLHFGYPYCHGRDVRDPEFGSGKRCADYRPPAQELGPHVASLGLLFYSGEMFPDEYRGDVLIAEHGSWDRSTPIGYRVTRVRVAEGEAAGYEVFASGWLQGEEAWGRPVDLLQLPDGSLLVSDDRAGAIYRIAYRTPAAGPAP
ncbi:MAG TPA: PQQ-dependent sugar dehydrogenase [Thermoanaerobaculia bacterium]|nr:PQQ-dependent sugar dehydrogenase [Thermoanaerobaculia bacterium]